MIRAAAVASVLALAAAPAVAEEVADLTAASGIAGKTWIELVRQALPGIAPGPNGGVVVRGKIKLRPIDKEPPPGGDCPDPVAIQALEVARPRIANKERLIVGVAIDGDQCAAPLLLLEGDGQGKLLDAANVKQDEHYFFPPDFVQPLGAGGQLVVVNGGHTKAGEGFETRILVLATEAKLAYIGGVSAHNQGACQSETWEKPTIRTAPRPTGFAEVAAEVESTVKRKGADCVTPQGKDTVTTTRTLWRWIPAKRGYKQVSE